MGAASGWRVGHWKGMGRRHAERLTAGLVVIINAPATALPIHSGSPTVRPQGEKRCRFVCWRTSSIGEPDPTSPGHALARLRLRPNEPCCDAKLDSSAPYFPRSRNLAASADTCSGIPMLGRQRPGGNLCEVAGAMIIGEPRYRSQCGGKIDARSPKSLKSRVSSAVEQRFCKPLVGSSILSPGIIAKSGKYRFCGPKVAVRASRI